MGKWQIEDSEWPIVRVVLEGKFEDAEIDDVLAGISDIFTRGKIFSCIADFRGLREPSISHRSLLRNWMKEHEAYTRKNCRGVAYVVTSAPISILLQAIFKVQRPTAPTRVTSDMRVAEAWARKQLA